MGKGEEEKGEGMEEKRVGEEGEEGKGEEGKGEEGEEGKGEEGKGEEGEEGKGEAGANHVLTLPLPDYTNKFWRSSPSPQAATESWTSCLGSTRPSRALSPSCWKL
jgi:hypothetical protein